MVSGNIKETNDSNLPLVAECIKTRLIETTSKETQECFIEVIQQGTEDVSKKIVAKISQLREQGFICDNQGKCHKEIEGERTQTVEELDRESLLG